MESNRLVILEGGLPWGFRIQGGCDTGFPLRIARVNPGSKAALQGIREGDLITSINDRPTEGPVTNQEAHGLLKEAGPTLRLGLKQGSSLSRRLLNKSSPSPSGTSNGNSSESQIFNFAGGADGQLLTNSGAGSSNKKPLFSNNKTACHWIEEGEEGDPAEGIDSILTEMEQEILQTGGEEHQPVPAMRIGGLTIEEFVHFLALLERVKEQHLMDPPPPLDDSEHSRNSPYDNLAGQQKNQHNVATSPRISPPSDDSASSSSGSSSTIGSPDSSASSCSADFDIPGCGFTPLEKLFLRRYLHVIPEEALNGGSDCGGGSSRLSRALSGISSALSFLEDDQHFDSGGEEETSMSDLEPSSSALPAVLNDSRSVADSSETSTVDGQADDMIPATLDDTIVADESPMEDESNDVLPTNTDDFITVTAMPAIVIESLSDRDSSGADEVAPLPRVVEDLESVRTGSDCQIVDESLLPLSVLLIQQSSTPDAEKEVLKQIIETNDIEIEEEPPLVHPINEPEQPTVQLVLPDDEPDACDSTSVVTLVDDKIVCVEYHPPASSSALLVIDQKQSEEPPCNEEPAVPVSTSHADETVAEPAPVPVSELRRIWEMRCDPEASTTSKPPPERTDFWSGSWPPPPPPVPPPPDQYDPFSRTAPSSETETGYSTDGSEPLFRRRKPPPPRPTPPLHYRPDPPSRNSSILLRPDNSDPDNKDDDDDERTKARLLADWLQLAHQGSSSTSVLSTAYTASSPKPGVWSPGQTSPPQRDTSDTPKGEAAIGDSNQDHQPPVWIPASQQPSPRLERKEFRPVRLDTAALNKKQQEGDWSPKSNSSSSGSGKPAAPSSLPPLLLSSWEKHRSSSQPQQPHNAQQQTPLIAPTSTASASSTPLNTPASDHSASALTSTSTNYSVLSWDRRTTASSNYSGGGSGSTTPTPSIHPLLSQQTTSTPTSHLPKAPNPTVTLLQKAREGQLPKGAAYLDSASSSGKPGPVVPATPPQQPLYRTPYEQAYSFQREYSSSSSTADGNNSERRKVGDLTSNKFSGTGSNSQEGVPVPLRSNVREEDHHQWYRRMYESLHKQGGPSDYVTIRYKTGKGRGGGYQSEPDQGRQSSRYDYDSDAGRYATLDRRRQRIHNDSESNGSPSRTIGEADLYRIQPGRIEDYVPGVRSSITTPVESSAKQAQRNLNIPSKSFTNFALKESGYESDSQLVFRRRYPAEPGGEASLASPATDPQEQRVWYRDIQRGGEVPLHGLRKPQPERSQVGQEGDGFLFDQHAPGAAHRFLESEVTINYRRPIRSLQQGGHQQLGEMDEEELRQLQAEHMKRVYEQERRRKYLQELEDIESRRHMDNFTPLMKSPIPLNRYDDFMDDQPVSSGLLSGRQSQQVSHQRERTPEPKIVARGLYNFVAQNARELSFHKGDIIFVRRQIDKNWYEGEHNAMIGIFPVNYVEIIPYDGVRMTNRKPSEGKGRVKFNFVAQTPVELSLVKGEMVIITRQVDEHWLEGRIGQRRGIFPISYIDVIQPSSSQLSDFAKTPAQPTGGSSMITNGSLRTATNYRSQPQYASLPKMSPMNPPVTNQYQQQHRSGAGYKPSPLMIDTRSSEPVMYRALYTYVPQNEDELELQEGESICVLEKCDDGWYVGTSQRTGLFGTFPGNYVERI